MKNQMKTHATLMLTNGLDNCDNCPKCKEPFNPNTENLSIDFVDFSLIIICDGCNIRVKIKGGLGEKQKSFLSGAI